MSNELKIQLFRPTIGKTGKKRPYQCQWVDPVTGKKKTKSTGTTLRRDAEKFRATLAVELESGQFQTERMNWEMFRERFELAALPGKAKATQAELRTTMNRIEDLIAPVRPEVLNLQIIDEFANKLRSEGRTEMTVKKHLANIRNILRWAKSQGYLKQVPQIRMPKSSGMKGRPISREEFERMLMAVPKVVAAAEADRWRFLLQGLWASGLRIGEAIQISWDPQAQIRIVMCGGHPMIDFAAAVNKNRKDQTIPMSPELALLLSEVPQNRRHGRVFRIHYDKQWCSKVVARIGRKANIKTAEADNAKVRYASAHDLRRSFGFRWAAKIPTPFLQQVMRHEDVKTTLEFYVGRHAQTASEAMWNAFANSSTNTPPQPGSITIPSFSETPTKQGA